MLKARLGGLNVIKRKVYSIHKIYNIKFPCFRALSPTIVTANLASRNSALIAQEMRAQ